MIMTMVAAMTMMITTATTAPMIATELSEVDDGAAIDGPTGTAIQTHALINHHVLVTSLASFPALVRPIPIFSLLHAEKQHAIRKLGNRPGNKMRLPLAIHVTRYPS